MLPLTCVLTYHTNPKILAPQLLRVIDSLQLAAKLPVATPANWHQGEAALPAADGGMCWARSALSQRDLQTAGMARAFLKAAWT